MDFNNFRNIGKGTLPKGYVPPDESNEPPKDEAPKVKTPKTKGPRKPIGKYVGIGIGVIVIISIIVSSIRYVDAGFVGVKTINGAVAGAKDQNGKIVGYEPALEPGIHFLVPFIENIVPVETRTQIYKASVAGASKDIQDVTAEVTLTYHVDPYSAPELYNTVSFNIGDRLFYPAVQGMSKTVMPQYTAEEIVQKRPLLVKDIENDLRSRLQTRGLAIENIDVTNVSFTNAFTKSIEDKVIANQNAQKAENEVKIAQAEAQKKIAQADGEKQSAILSAQGQAESIRIINEQLHKSPDYLNYLKTQRWDGKLPLVIGSGVAPFINLQDLGNSTRPN